MADKQGTPALKYQVDLADATADSLRLRIASLRAARVASPDPMLLKQHLRAFERLRREIAELEVYMVTVIERFGGPDQRLTALCQRLGAQVGGELPPFIVSTLSTVGYASYGDFEVIQVPAAEECSLLGLPDLMHEMGHWLFDRDETDFLADVESSELRPLVARLKRKPLRLTPAPQLPWLRRKALALLGDRRGRIEATTKWEDLCERLSWFWQVKWTREIVSDMLGAYVFGAAYAQQHLRLNFGEGSRLYVPTLLSPTTHPANRARLEAVLMLLERCEAAGAAEAARVRTYWQPLETYARANGDVPDEAYELSYPSTVMGRLADNTIKVCNDRRLRRFDMAPGLAPDIPSIVRHAWEVFVADPAAYSAWERTTLAVLWSQLGVAEPSA